MLSPKIPKGRRNPNGYSADEVLRAIRAVDGTRELSFRYELLDKNLKYKQDLDNVISASVQMSYISDIKRTAKFTLFGESDFINWLDDHIKPYCRIKMPPKMVDDGIPLNVLWQNSFNATSGNVTTQNSGNYGSTLSRVNGTVRYSGAWAASGVGSCLLGSDDGSDSGSFSFNFRSRKTWKFSFYINVPVGSSLNFFPDGLDINTENYMRFDDTFGQYNLGSVNIQHIKENLFGQPVRVVVTNDGLRCRYDLYWTDPSGNDPDFTVTEDSSFWEAVQIISVGGGGFTRSPSFIDEIRISVPGSVELLPRQESVWSNSFNGPSGSYVDSDSLRYFGSAPDEVMGDVLFNSSWSEEGDGSSLQLGDQAQRGSMLVSLPSRSEWAMTCYANIPQGGKLFICPSPEGSVPPPEEAPVWAGPIQKVGTLGGSSWSAEITAAVPVGTQQGDRMVAVVASNDNNRPPVAPSGWDLLDSREFGEDTWIYVYEKTAGNNEPANYGWTFETDHWHAAMIQTWRNTNGVRFVGINSSDSAVSVSLPQLSAESGDALCAVGFDWDDVLKTWDDGEVMTTDLHQSQGLIVSSQLNLGDGTTPTYALTKNSEVLGRMAAIAIVMSRIPNPSESSEYPGDILKVGFNSSGGWADSVTVDVPANVEEGDYMIASFSANAFNEIVPPDGWTLVGDTGEDMGTGTTLWIYERFASSSEPASYTWTFNGSHWHYGAITAWRNTLGMRHFAISGGEGVTSVMTQEFTSFPGDALVLCGFDWENGIKSWNDNNELTTDINIDQSQIVSSLMDLPGGMTPTYALTGAGGNPTRMAAATIVLESYDEPESGGMPFRGPNWIVLDDAAGEYTIAGVDVSEYVDQLIGTPIRIEMETYGGQYWWQVYSTDPHGSAPDINWFGSAQNWGSFQSCLFQGGGTGLPGSLIDNVTISRIVPVRRPTPEDTNFVEFPLGVFLLASPTREIDADDVVTREVEAYDRTKLFVDDKLTERFTVTKGTVYTDVISQLLGDIPKIVEPSKKVCSRLREWQIGTSIKEVIDAIAEGMDYHTLRFDEEGRAVVQPYISSDDRTPEFHYEDNEISIMYPDVEVEFDAFDIANVWISTVSEVDGDPIYAKLENWDPANPFSIPRRGRKIVDFRQEEEATDYAGLVRKVKRLQFEANRVYENISFSTLINPLHSANDCYTISFGRMGIQEKYTEINWEFSLEAGAEMTHTARRVVKLNEEDDPGFVEDSLTVNGAFTAGNMAWGYTTVPINRANTPQSVRVTGLDLQGTGKVEVFVTAESSNALQVKGVTSQDESPTGFTIWVYRTNTVNTGVYWFAVRSL